MSELKSLIEKHRYIVERLWMLDGFRHYSKVWTARRAHRPKAYPNAYAPTLEELAAKLGIHPEEKE